jgi:hypothetical protein
VDYIGQSWFSTHNGSLTAPHVMPAMLTFLHASILLWTSLIHLGSAVPLKRADSCPGYKASNVQRSESSLTADLTLAGTACNIHGEDLLELKFSAQWQTGMFLPDLPLCLLSSKRCWRSKLVAGTLRLLYNNIHSIRGTSANQI